MSNYYILKKYFFPFVIIFFTELYTYSMECPVCWNEVVVMIISWDKLEVILKKYIA